MIQAGNQFNKLKNRQLSFSGEFFKKFHAFVGIAFGIEFRTPDGDGILLWMNRNNSSTNSAFSRKSDFKCKLAGFIIKSAGLHQSIDSFSLATGEYLCVFFQSKTIIGKKQKQIGKFFTAHFQRAKVEVKVQNIRRIVFNVSKGFNQIT